MNKFNSYKGYSWFLQRGSGKWVVSSVCITLFSFCVWLLYISSCTPRCCLLCLNDVVWRALLCLGVVCDGVWRLCCKLCLEEEEGWWERLGGGERASLGGCGCTSSSCTWTLSRCAKKGKIALGKLMITCGMVIAVTSCLLKIAKCTRVRFFKYFWWLENILTLVDHLRYFQEFYYRVEMMMCLALKWIQVFSDLSAALLHNMREWFILWSCKLIYLNINTQIWNTVQKQHHNKRILGV